MILKPSPINDEKNFVLGWYISPTLCEEILAQYNDVFTGKLKINNHPLSYDKDRGYYVGNLPHCVTKEVVEGYVKELFTVVEEYKKIYPYCYKDLDVWGLAPEINIQRYLPGESYSMWHCENVGLNKDITARNFFFITYLNNVTDGGETEFYHQKLKVKPEKGLTIFAPAYWPWYHRGHPSPTQEKTIVTGWFQYYYKDKDNNLSPYG